MSLEDIEDSSCADSQDLQTLDEEINTDELSQNLTEQNFSKDIEFQKNSISVDESQEICESEIDQKFYEEILEKLDIKSKENSNEKNQDIQNKLMQEKLKQETSDNQVKNLQKSQAEMQIKTAITQDFDKIQKLVKAGLINSGQGQNLKKQVLKKAFDKLVQTEKVKRSRPAVLQDKSINNETFSKQKVFEEFSQSNPNFFTSDGRKEVLNYLQSDGVNLGKDDLSKISSIVRTVEKAAIDRYLKKVAHEKTLRQSNENAKQRLTANAQKSGFSAGGPKSFTREQIGKMSSAEFTKYEPIIMENLKKGLIK